MIRLFDCAITNVAKLTIRCCSVFMFTFRRSQIEAQSKSNRNNCNRPLTPIASFAIHAGAISRGGGRNCGNKAFHEGGKIAVRLGRR